MDRHAAGRSSAGRRHAERPSPSSALLTAALWLALAPLTAAAGPPFPDPVDGQAVYDSAELFTPGDPVAGRGDHRCHRGADQGRGRRLHARRSVATTSRPTRPKRTRGADGPMGRRAGRHQRRAGHPVRSRHHQAPRPGPALRRPRVRDVVSLERRAPGDLRDHDAAAAGRAATSTPRCWPPSPRSSAPPSTGSHPASPASRPAPESAPGPPFPEPEIDRAVYDYAGIFSPGTIVAAEATIDAIETRTAAEVVVYTQARRLRRHDRTRPRSRARALIDQWGIGRAGLRRRPGDLLRHRPVLGARPGPALRGARLRGRLPLEQRAPGDLRQRHGPAPPRGRLRRRARGGHAQGRRRGTRRTTPRSSRPLARSMPSVGLVGAPGRRSSACRAGRSHWRRFGKDPVYLDDPSILMPAPPPDLTAAPGRW